MADPLGSVNGEQLRAVLAAEGASGSWDWDIPNDRLIVNDKFAELCGLEELEEGASRPSAHFFKAIHRDDRARIKIAVAGLLAGAETFSKEFRIVSPSGETLWMHGRGQGHLDADDHPVRFTGLLVDVTERKRTEERLRIAQSAGRVGTFEYVDGFATVSVSGEFCRLLGLHPAERLPVRTINAVLCEGEKPLIPDSGDALAPESLDAQFCILRGEDREQRWIARRGEVIRDGQGSGYRLLGVIYDVTDAKRQETALRELNETLEQRVAQEVAERQQAEESLRQSHKMEAVGQLTGGLAHDFNNLLAGISGALELMQMRIGQGRIQDAEKYIIAAQGASRRAATLTHRLLAFSRRQTLDPKATNVNQVASGLVDMIQRTVGPGIAVENVAASGLWTTLVDVPQLENAILNLCINARDSMPDGGRITIETCNRWLDREAARQQDIPEGQYISLCVSDTGTGMSPDVIEKAFDPFFTTKPIGEGTGLGLSMIYGFAKQSGGQVRIYSELGEGTMVCIYLPRHRGEVEVDERRTESVPMQQADAGETVLVVDDEVMVRMLITDVLEELGYQAIEAGDSATGLRILDSDAKVDLLITDVGLPGGMNGRQMADAARERRPDLKVLFITGYAENALFNNRQLEPGMSVLTKPFAMETLASRIRDLIVS